MFSEHCKEQFLSVSKINFFPSDVFKKILKYCACIHADSSNVEKAMFVNITSVT
jgi:hypothetical protein